MLEIFGTPFVIPLWLKKVISTLGMALVVSGGFMACMQFAVSYFGREAYAAIPASIIDHEFRCFFGLFALLTFCLMMIFQPWSLPNSTVTSFPHSTSQSEKPTGDIQQAPTEHHNTTSTEIKIDNTPSRPTSEGPTLSSKDKTEPWTTENELNSRAALSHVPASRVFTPRTPKELMDIARRETKRDAMRHKDDWIHVEGPVFDITEEVKRSFGTPGKTYIEVKVAIGPPPHDSISGKVRLYLEAEQWKPQVDKIERGDWLSAIGIVHSVYAVNMDVINGEIISVSGPDGERK